MDIQKLKAMKRIKEEYKDSNRNPVGNIGFTVGLYDENNIFEWRVSLLGPKDSSYKGGLFYMMIKFPVNYPEIPPEICFENPIYHINVNPFKPNKDGDESLGHVSLNILKYWKPEYTIKEVLTHLFVCLTRPNPDCSDTYGLEKANEFRNNRRLYEEKARYFTKKYTNPTRVNSYLDIDSDWDFSCDIKI